MIPRLQPRSSLKRPSGVENTHPADTTHRAKTNAPSLSIDASTASVPSFPDRATSSQMPLSTPIDKRIFPIENAKSKELSNRPLSLSRPFIKYRKDSDSPISDKGEHCHENLKSNCASASSTCKSIETEGSSMNQIDYPLTPPAGSRPPLLVSAKKHGSEVRRQHSKRRRIRRRPSGSRRESDKRFFVSGKSDNTTGRDSGKEKDSDNLCLWKVDDPGERDSTYLPSLESSDEEEEETNRIEEVVRAEHRKEAMGARAGEGLQQQKGSFSANRVPPPKGCLSNPRPKRPRGETTRYKTPPKSIDGEPSLSGSNTNQRRRVQFGIPSAVEYEVENPPGHLTPMSQEVTKKRYSMDPKEPSREDEEITQETKQNNLILSEWEDQFSASVEDNVRRSHRKRRRESSSKKRNRKNRRSSSIFSPSSRISLEHSHTTIDHPSTKEHENTLPLTASQSNSASDAMNSTSISFSSSKKSFNVTSCSNASPQATPLTNAGRLAEARTWNFVADLGSINSKGAMELSPNPANSNTKQPLCLISQNSISRAGESATELGTDNQTRLHVDFDNLKPSGSIGKDVSTCRPDFVKECASSVSVLSSREGAKDESSNFLSRKLIASPWSDREWEFLTLLRNLSSSTRKEETNTERFFKVLNSCIKNALAFDVDFVDHIFRMLSCKPLSPGKFFMMNTKRARTIEWTRIEINHMENLTKVLEQFRLRVEESACRVSSSVTNSRSEERELETEISKLENEIQRVKSSFDLLEASKAPISSISCQAAAQIGMYGFCFQKFHDEHTLELEYMHAVFEVKTRVIVDISSRPEISIDYIDNTPNRAQDPISDFHRRYIDMLKVGKVSFQLKSAEIQDSLLRLGQILGKLDQCALAFSAINKGTEAAIAFDLPQIRFAFPQKNATASLTLDLTFFQVKMMTFSAGGIDFSVNEADILSSVDCCDLKSISKLIFKSAANECVE